MGTLNDFVFPNRNDYMAHMSTRQYARLVHEWVVGIGLPAPTSERTRLGARKHRSSTRRLATSAPFRSFSAMRPLVHLHRTRCVDQYCCNADTQPRPLGGKPDA